MSTIGTVVVVTALITACILILVCLEAALSPQQPEEVAEIPITDRSAENRGWQPAPRRKPEPEFASVE